MHTHLQNRPGARDGVALIICLGLLAIMTLLAVTFAIAMRVERMAARNFQDGVRARHLAQVAMVRAMQQIDSLMVQRVYPPNEVIPSSGVSPTNLISAGAARWIPAGTLLDQALASQSGWITTGIPSGRVAYVVLNTSGLIDANSVGGAPRVWSTNFQEISFGPTSAPEMAGGATMNQFLADRASNKVYETIFEMKDLTSTINNDVRTFNTFSYEPGSDVLFLTSPHGSTPPQWWTRIENTRPPPSLGTRDAYLYLTNKFNINSITNFPQAMNYSSAPNKYMGDANFMANYYTPLRAMLAAAVFTSTADRPNDIAWNIINYLDNDRFPHGDTLFPWSRSEGGEAIPLVNELAIVRVDMPGYTTNVWVEIANPRSPGYPGYWETVQVTGGPGYHLNAELWYPFAPTNVQAFDNIGVQIWIYNDPPLPPTVSVYDITNTPYINTNYSFTAMLDNMTYGSETEFQVFSNRVAITFPPDPQVGNSLTPLGHTHSGTGTVPAGQQNAFRFLVRVTKGGVNGEPFAILDEAMGYDPADQGADRRQLFRVASDAAVRSYQINDPRSNGQVRYWTTPRNGQTTVGSHTLGTTNINCRPSGQKRHGVPIYAMNGPMRNIGELGHIWLSNLDDEDPAHPWWRNINLMHRDLGAKLLDMMTVRNSSPPHRGVFAANSRSTDAWKVMFHELQIGVPGVGNSDLYLIPQPEINNVINAIQQRLSSVNVVSFTDLFTAEQTDEGGGGPVAQAFRECAPGYLDGLEPNDIYMEDTFRHVAELLSFRQNIFTIVLAAQVLAPDQVTPIAERRAVATVFRDAYTGRRFVRSFAWLDD